MNDKLKKAILIWLCDNKNECQRLNACVMLFKQYIFDTTGNYIIGGVQVADFIRNADNLIYSDNE